MSSRFPHRRLGVLVSGRGSNLQALLDAVSGGRLDATIAVVISNRADAFGLERARKAGVEALHRDHRQWPVRDDYDRALVDDLKSRGVELVCLAGFMRRLGKPMIEAFPEAIVNIHPSLLPSFPGLDAQQQAVDHGVRVSGVTVHLVTAELDAGPIIVQRAVEVSEHDTRDSLAAKILEEEHAAYPEAVQQLLAGRWAVTGRRFVRR